MEQTIKKRDFIVDTRCLQDPSFSHRGIGSHAASLLAGGLRMERVARQFRFVALVDPSLPDLSSANRQLFEEIRITPYRRPGSPECLFFEPSPMTHDTHRIARLQNRSNSVSVACVYDFIPHEFPEHYLTSPDSRVFYYSRLSALRNYHALFPISESTRRRLTSLLGSRPIPSFTTGVALRELFHEQPTQAPPSFALRRILVPSGSDWRKNPELVIRAHASSLCLQSCRVVLTILGHDDPASKKDMYDLVLRYHGNPDLLELPPFVDDRALRQLYRDSSVVVVPSIAEGFSMPVIEASSQGTPVLVSDCDAHAELVPDPEDRFAPHDDERLRGLLEQIAGNPALLRLRQQRQGSIWERYTQQQVCERFWNGVLMTAGETARRDIQQSRPTRRPSPKLAFLSPMPPWRSGCADHSAALLRALTKLAHVDLFTATPQPVVPEGAVHAGVPQALAHLSSKYDAVISVLGNSSHHRREFDLLLSYGASCIAHDIRMLNFYLHEFGETRTLALAEAELRRPVTSRMLQHWVDDPGDLPILLLSEVAACADPLILHSPLAAELVNKHYGREALVLPFGANRNFTEEELSAASRAAARARLGLSEQTIIVASFGLVHLDKAPLELIWALEQLRCWGYDARLAFVGSVDVRAEESIAQCGRETGLENYILHPDNTWDESVYRDWLLACDVAVQLRTFQLGALSGALLDCITAAIPTVANDYLCRTVGAPDYVSRVPNGLSAFRIAEEIAGILDAGRHRQRPLDARRQDAAGRTFEVYSQRLLAALGVD
jgi:glycosyltransferase involved in cell wall biosynthesis